ncbi:hypothetical protein G5C51_04360 [Streptomyces sp. A7024]|uniref:Uncharacterized protein n=1 Tax=Streptomyces coryli TaxID=1128680 RepID=A0A6G4TUB7_9ACTN|nr:hypothetical protein [Streptomyces coryli]NGN63140.1 hypothetical protein [Streptomyces coryli]
MSASTYELARLPKLRDAAETFLDALAAEEKQRRQAEAEADQARQHSEIRSAEYSAARLVREHFADTLAPVITAEDWKGSPVIYPAGTAERAQPSATAYLGCGTFLHWRDSTTRMGGRLHLVRPCDLGGFCETEIKYQVELAGILVDPAGGCGCRIESETDEPPASRPAPAAGEERMPGLTGPEDLIGRYAKEVAFVAEEAPATTLDEIAAQAETAADNLTAVGIDGGDLYAGAVYLADVDAVEEPDRPVLARLADKHLSNGLDAIDEYRLQL